MKIEEALREDVARFGLSRDDEGIVGDLMQRLGGVPLHVLGYLTMVLLENFEVPENTLRAVRLYIRSFLDYEKRKGEALRDQ